MNKYDEIANEAVSKAEGLDGTLEEFLQGLQLIQEVVEDRIFGVEEEIAEKNRRRG